MTTPIATIVAYSTAESVVYNNINMGIAPNNGSSVVASIRLKNTGTKTVSNANLYTCRGDMLRMGGPRYTNEEEFYANQVGEELVNERWTEVRLVGGSTWTAIDEYDHGFVLGEMLADGFVDIEMRVTAPTGAMTFGDIDFCLVVRCN